MSNAYFLRLLPNNVRRFLFLLPFAGFYLTSCQTSAIKEPLPDMPPSGARLAACTTPAGTPRGFQVTACGNAVRLFRRNDVFVVEVDLLKNGQCRLIQGSADTASAAVPNPQLVRRPLFTNISGYTSYWNLYAPAAPKLFAVANAQFFSTAASPRSDLAFPIKVNNKLIGTGYGSATTYGKRRLEFYGAWANIVEYPYASTGLTAVQTDFQGVVSGIAGIHPINSDFSKNASVGRTMIGLKDTNQDGKLDRLLLVCARAATQQQAWQVLVDFNCVKTIMFDGGGSSQLACRGVSYVASSRTIPSIFAIYDN